MNRRSLQSGSTLMLALWALVLLSAVVMAWGVRIDREIDSSNEDNRAMEARAMAHSGIAVARHPEVSWKNPALQGQPGRGQSYRVSIASEGGRINLNYWLAGAEPRKIDYLKRYLALKGLDLQERETLIDCLLDWVNPPAAGKRARGVAESPDYPIPHRPLQSLDELAQVNGSAPLLSRPAWRDDLTLYSTGPLDLEGTPPEFLAMVPGIGDQRATRFVKTREERLQRSTNPDGHPFKDLTDALNALGMSRDEFEALSMFLKFRDPVVRIRSVGQSAGITKTTEAVVNKTPGDSAQILLWIEN
ncbi:MAG: general secretion pathway protein GspK [Chthoniobacteraceae bacterium]